MGVRGGEGRVVTDVYCTLTAGKFPMTELHTASCVQLCIENLPAVKDAIYTVPTIADRSLES